jgi:hypothetical protein
MRYDYLLKTFNVVLFLLIPAITMALLVAFSRAPSEAPIPADEEDLPPKE